MISNNYQDYYNYLSEYVIAPFYQIRLEKLDSLKLKKVLRRKNPYLFKAKNIELAGDLVKGIVDAYLSSQEEGIFGNLLEGFAIYVSQKTDNGFKSALKSVDLEFEREAKYYVVGIKSGTNWGNSDQIIAMRNHFKLNKTILRERGVSKEIVAINGCIYGKDGAPFKKHSDSEKEYYKFAGQDFWDFISNDNNLYREIIAPIDEQAKQKDKVFKKAYSAKINEMTKDFLSEFVTENQIDWLKLIDFVSKRV